jgi:hypothetical protein
VRENPFPLYFGEPARAAAPKPASHPWPASFRHVTKKGVKGGKEDSHDRQVDSDRRFEAAVYFIAQIFELAAYFFELAVHLFEPRVHLTA